MKKIYLIDDNLDGNRNKYGSTFVDDGKYADILCAIDKISLADDLEFLNTAACVLLHKTLNDYFDGKFHEDSQKVATFIGQMPNIGNRIPLVIFSDGFTSDIGDYDIDRNPNEIYSLSKRALYSRLESFVIHYRDTIEIDLRILAFGEDFATELIEKAAVDVFSRLQDFADTETLDATKIACPKFRQIIDMSQPAIGKNYIEIINDLQLNPISIFEFKNRLNNILENFQDYGKNYSVWK